MLDKFQILQIQESILLIADSHLPPITQAKITKQIKVQISMTSLSASKGWLFGTGFIRIYVPQDLQETHRTRGALLSLVSSFWRPKLYQLTLQRSSAVRDHGESSAETNSLLSSGEIRNEHLHLLDTVKC